MLLYMQFILTDENIIKYNSILYCTRP